MKKIIFFLLLVSLPMVALCQENNQQNFAYADSVMSANYKADAPGAVLLIARNGHPVFEKAYGMANMELKIPDRTDYNFEIGSITKQFTAVAILQLVQKGKLNLQDNLHKYLPRYNTHGRHITIENLLTHTSGIPSYTEEPGFNWRENISKDSLMMRVSRDSLLFEPGTNWSYSNTGFFLLGMVIKKITGETYADYIQKNILEPLHMDHTYVGIGNKVIPNLVTGYAYVPGNGNYKDAIDFPLSEAFSAGDMISNINDLLKWDNALYTNKLVNPRLLQKAWTSYTLKNGKKTGYGFGWFVTHNKNVKLIWHGGALPGFLSDVIRIPKKHAYIALLSNTSNVSPVMPAMLIAFHTSGPRLMRPPAIKPNPALFKDYTGVYDLHAESGRLVSNSSSKKMYFYITRKKDTLFVQTPGGTPAPLVPIAKDEFISSANGADSLLYTTYHFVRGDNGKVKAMKIKGALNMLMTRTEPKTNLPLPKKKKAIHLPADVLQQYAGKYRFAGGAHFIINITVKGDKMYITSTLRQKPDELFPASKTKFFSKVVDAEIDFTVNKNGKVTGLIAHRAGTFKFKKVK